MSESKLEEIPLKNKKNPTDVQRQRQIATLNDDKMNVPRRKPFSFYIEHFIITIFQLLSAYLIYSNYFPQNSNRPQTNLDNHFNDETRIINRTSHSFSNSPKSTTQNSQQFNDSFWEYFFLGLIFLCCSLAQYWASSIRRHLQNCKHISELTNCFNKMRNSVVNLSFTIQCYHMENSEHQKNQNSKKVITHSASKIIQFSQCYDLSGFIKPDIQKDFKKPYIFIDYKADYEMLEESEKTILETMYNNFVKQNTRDVSQDHKKTFEFSDCEAKTQQSYFLEKEMPELKPILLIASFSLLIWPISMLIDYFYIEKYEITILKKVKIDENQQGYTKLAA